METMDQSLELIIQGQQKKGRQAPPLGQAQKPLARRQGRNR